MATALFGVLGTCTVDPLFSVVLDSASTAAALWLCTPVCGDLQPAGVTAFGSTDVALHAFGVDQFDLSKLRAELADRACLKHGRLADRSGALD
tara:strand:+ start:37 stop:315 length:279 start_codon:yes stop_codon:yes gene_type:complete